MNLARLSGWECQKLPILGDILRVRLLKMLKKSWKNRITALKSQSMRFVLIDKVVSLEENDEIKALKSVSLAEEYLSDHFPIFPVLPGVLLLEGLVESAAWLVRKTQNFANSMVLLESARNVKYKSFAAPGTQIEYSVKAKNIDENISSFTGTGRCGQESIVEARFALRHFNLADDNPKMAAVDEEIIDNLRKRWKLLVK
jgi:3-hydroxyacyl-[acyl-carrier-protein] dehydratase